MRGCRVRIITVPEKLHKEWEPSPVHLYFTHMQVRDQRQYSEGMQHGGLYSLSTSEYVGKNVGARRATGEYLLFSNPDIVPSPQLLNFLKTNELRRNAFYRSWRVDLDEPLPLNSSTVDLLRGLQKSAAAVELIPCHNYTSGRMMDSSGRSLPRQPRTGIPPGCVPDSQGLFLDDPMDGELCLNTKYHSDENAGLSEGLLDLASGDFILVHQDAFAEVFGFHEVQQADYLDTLLLCKLRANSIRQIPLLPPCVTFHQPHIRPPWRYTGAFDRAPFRFEDKPCDAALNGTLPLGA